jgi:signal transduction histidine kinase
MTAEQVEHVFDKFYRADASNTAVQGVGLGMSIVRHIIQAHQGEIRVESQPGAGTTILIDLPLSPG